MAILILSTDPFQWHDCTPAAHAAGDIDFASAHVEGEWDTYYGYA